ncbi:MAG TPA: DUF1598 domain-containing protein [Pirellulales bacterium]
MRIHRIFAALIGAALLWGQTTPTLAQNNNNNGFGGSAVGGVEVDANGVLGTMTVDQTNRLRQERQAALVDQPADLSTQTAMRKVSLKRLSAHIQEQLRSGKPIPQDAALLAGLTRIQYVFVYPEENDVVLAGPAEGWKIGPNGEVIGAKTGAPTLQLEDLITALRLVSGDVQQNITVSIDPTQDGMARFQQYAAGLRNLAPGAANAQVVAGEIEQALGPQKITFGGVDPTSRLARILVAADYRMKRIGMGFEPAPINGLPSYLTMAGGGGGNAFPRWWMAANYDSLQSSPEGDAWELKGQGVKVMTEDSFFKANGEKVQTGKSSAAAQKWADLMTAKFEPLAAKSPIFGELRNVMDVAVVAALIVNKNLATNAGLDLSVFTNDSIGYPKNEVATEVPTKATFIKKAGASVITASGGVDIDPFTIVEKSTTTPELKSVRGEAKAAEKVAGWWWN